MTRRRAGHATDIASVMLFLWAGLSLLPVDTFWFDPGPVIVQDAFEGDSPALGFTRDIKRDTTMRYSVVMRDANLAIVCEDRSETFTYRTDATFPADGVDLEWWAPGNMRCHRPPPGTYILETCWTATDRLFGLLWDRSICRESNVFEVFLRNASKPRSLQLGD